jgi:hypothetical protein
VGTTNTFSQFTIDSVTGLSAITDDSNTVTSVSGNAVTRQFASDSHKDVIGFNDPFNGVRYRALNACTTSGGAAQNCGASLQLPMGGITWSWSGDASKLRTTVSVNKAGSN